MRKREYSVYKNVGRVSFSKEDLISFFEFLQVDFPHDKEPYVRIETNFENTSIKENSLEEFLKQELPEALERLEIILMLHEGREIDKYVAIRFSKTSITISVSGLNETWVVGKTAQIEKYLKSKRPVFWFVKSGFVYILQGIFLGFAGFLSITILLGPFTGENFNNYYFVGVLCLLLLSHYIIDKQNYAQIILKNRQSVVNRDNINVVIQVLILIATLLFGVLAIL